jgi:hypothetical protein
MPIYKGPACAATALFFTLDVTRSFYSAMCECFERKTFTLRTDNKSFESTRLRFFTSSTMSNAACTVEHQNTMTAFWYYFSPTDAFVEAFMASVAAHAHANGLKDAGIAPKAPRLQKTDLASVFHLPLSSAAAAIGICPTLLKRAARANGILKWPYRKLASIRKLQEQLAATRAAHCASSHDLALDQRIRALQDEIDSICFRPR